MPFIDKIKVENTEYALRDQSGAVYSILDASSVAGSATSGHYLSVRWYVSDVEGITEPYDGMKIAIKIPRIGVGTAGAVLSLNGDNTDDYHPVAYNVNTVLTSHYAVNSIKFLVYDASATMTCYLTSNTSKSVTGVWRCDGDYDSTNIYQLRDGSANRLGASTGDSTATRSLYRYEYLSQGEDGLYIPFGFTNNATTNYTKPLNKAGFRPYAPIVYYNATATVASGSNVAANTLYTQIATDIRYWANINSGGTAGTTALTAYRPVYIKGIYHSDDGLWYFDQDLTSSNYLERSSIVQELPDSNPNAELAAGTEYIYIQVGAAYSKYQIMLIAGQKQVFHWDATVGACVPFGGSGSGGVTSVNGQTGDVSLGAADVGALPSSTAYVKSATASGNTLTITPSSGTAVTFTPTFTAPVTSVNSKTGAVSLTASDVNALPSSTTYLKSASTSGNTLTITSSSGTAVTFTPTFTAPVTSVNSKTGAVSLTATDVDAIPKITYEWNKEFAAGSNGAVSLGRYYVYDSNLTFEITTTTSITFYGILIIATQNGRIMQAYLYGDVPNNFKDKIKIYQSAISGSRSYIEIYCNFPGWSKNAVHIKAVRLDSATVSNQLTSVTWANIPTTATDTLVEGVPVNVYRTLNTGSPSTTTTVNTSAHTHSINCATSTLSAVVTGSYSSSTGILTLTSTTITYVTSATSSASSSTTSVAASAHTHSIS